MDGSGLLTGLATILSSNVGSATKVPLALNNTTTLQQFPDNAVVRGKVVAKGAQQAVTIKTTQGNITIQTEVPLKRGAEVAFRVEQHGGNAIARLISVNGLSLGKYLEQAQGQQQLAGQDTVNTSSKLLQSNEAVTAKTTATAQAGNAAKNTTLPVTRGVFVILPAPAALASASLTPPMTQLLAQANIGTSVQLQITNIQVPNADGTGLQPLTSNAHTHSLSTIAPGTGYALTAAQRASATLPQMQVLQANNEAAQSTLPPVPTAQAGNNASQPQAPTNSINPAQTAAQVSGQVTGATGQASASSAATLPTGAPATGNPANDAQTNINTQNIITNAAPEAGKATMATQPNLPATSASTAAAGTTGTSSQSAAQSASNILQGVVINNSQPRELTVQTDIGTFKLFVTTSLPKNSVITFELINIADVRNTQQPQAAAQNSTELSSFKELEALTYTIPTEAAARTQPNLVPRTGANLTTEIVFLMTALKGGDFRKWIGDDNLKQLELQGKSNMLGKLANDFKALGNVPAEPRDNNWHQLLIPLAHEQQINPIKLFTKGQEHETPNGARSTTDHFLVDIELTRLGRMQIDGLVQQRGRSIQFDAVIRTDTDWNASMQQDIRNIYARAQEISGFSGALRFDTKIVPLPIDNEPQPPSNGRSIIA